MDKLKEFSKPALDLLKDNQHSKQIAIIGASTLLATGLLYSMNNEPKEMELNLDSTNYHIGVEMGGTSCKVGIIKGLERLDTHKEFIVETTSPAETIKKMCDWLNQQPEVYSSIGIASFGPICLNKNSDDYGCITTTPKIAWQMTPLLQMMLDGIAEAKKTAGFRYLLETDCNLLARFELERGGHTDIADNICYITVGTGVGVGLIINGKYVHGMIHPEGGHVSVKKHPLDAKKYPGFKGVCPFHGDKCIEGLCTNVAIMKRLGLKSVEEVKDLPDSHEVWEIVGHYLGTMCANLTLTLSLEKIVIGGGIMKRGDILLEHTRKAFEERIGGYLKH